MHTSLLIPYFSCPWTFPSHRFYVLINYQNPENRRNELSEEKWTEQTFTKGNPFTQHPATNALVPATGRVPNASRILFHPVPGDSDIKGPAMQRTPITACSNRALRCPLSKPGSRWLSEPVPTRCSLQETHFLPAIQQSFGSSVPDKQCVVKEEHHGRSHQLCGEFLGVSMSWGLIYAYVHISCTNIHASQQHTLCILHKRVYYTSCVCVIQQHRCVSSWRERANEQCWTDR